MTNWPPPTMVLTAGVGSRLGPLSHLRAKAALPVAGRPLIARILTRLSAQGIRDVVLNLHHRPETVAAVVGDGQDLGVRVRYSWEPRLLGSLGGVRRALPMLDAERLLIVNGDVLTDLDLRALWEAHARSGATVTMALAPFPARGTYGGVAVSPDGIITGFRRREALASAAAATGVWHFISAQVVARALVASVPADTPIESVRDIYPVLVKEEPGRVRGFVSDATFLDAGTPLEYLNTSLTVAAAEGTPASLIGHGSRIDPRASVTDTVVWDHAVVGPDCQLTRCLVTDGAHVPAASRHDSCILMRRQDYPASVEVTTKARFDGDLAIVEL